VPPSTQPENSPISNPATSFPKLNSSKPSSRPPSKSPPRLLSTGPTSEAGKAISSLNNFRHGLTQTEGDLVLLESESKADYAQRLAEFQKEWKPSTATEQDLVERLASRQWLRRRALKLQKLFLAPNGLITDEKQFALYRRYETQHERAYNKALSDLLRLRALQLREQNGFESQKRKDALHAYQLQAAKDRQTRNQLAVQTAEVRLLLAQHKASLIETTVPTPADTSAVPQTQNLETPDFLTANR
jgi:hypothetical protein